MAQGLYPQVKAHLILGKEHGLTKEEVVEIVTHGATQDGWFSHIAFSLPDESATTEWCEEVSAIEYNKL